MTGRLAIGRWKCTYIVPGEHPAPESVRQGMDSVVESSLVGGLQRVFGEWFDGNERAVWFLRRLDFDLDVRAGAHGEALGQRIAAACLRALTMQLRHGGDGDAVVFFRDRVDYISQFLVDLLHDRAWTRWYYADYDSLRWLGVGRAAYETLRRQVELVAPVLLQLQAQGECESLISAWSETEVAAVIDLLCVAERASPAPLSALLDALRGGALQPATRRVDTRRNALRMLLYLMREGIPPSRAMRNSVERFLNLLFSSKDVGASIASLERRAPSEPLAAELLAALRHDPALLAIVEALPPAEASRSAAGYTIASPHAGLFYLWAMFLRLGLNAPCRNDATLRYWIARKWLGDAADPEVCSDPAVLMFAGLEAPPSPEELRSWTIDGAQSHALQRILTLNLRRRGLIGDARVSIERVHLPGCIEEWQLIEDVTSGAWLGFFRQDRFARAFLTYLRDELSMAGESEPQEDEPVLSGPQTTREEATRRDLEFFALPNGPTDASADLTATLLARACLRSFSARLRGFGDSSAEYLFRNFLCSPGVITVGAYSIDVRLQPPSLHLVLRLAGLDRESFPLSDGRTVKITMDRDD